MSLSLDTRYSKIIPILAGLLGAAVSVLYAAILAPALEAHRYEMEGIPILFASWMFIPFLGGVTAGLAAPRRPYLAALLAGLGVVIAGNVVGSRPGPDTTIEGLLSPIPVGIPFALWGGLMADLMPVRFRNFRDSSVPLVFIISFLALLPVTTHWLPGSIGLLTALLIPAAFFTWIVRRNRRAMTTRPGHCHPSDDVERSRGR